MKKAEVDFSLACDLSWGHLIRKLKPELNAKLAQFPETHDRAVGAFWFSHLLDGEPLGLKQRESYLRAGLAEFVSMQDSLARDLKHAQISAQPLKIRECQEPEVHIFQYLRNLELHLQTSQVVSGRMNVVAGENELEITTWFIGDLDFALVAEARNAAWYSEPDLRSLVEWFNNAQKAWGIDELLRRAVIAYATRIVELYSLKPAHAV